MTIENSKRLIEHYKKLIENPDSAFKSGARIKQKGRESVLKEAKKHLEDMEENLRVREYLKNNPGIKLNPTNALKKLKVPQEAINKEIVRSPNSEVIVHVSFFTLYYAFFIQIIRKDNHYIGHVKC